MISIPAVLREIRGFPAGNANFLRKCHARLNMLPQRHFIIAFFLHFASTKFTILSLFYFRDGPDIPHHFRCLLIFTGESDSYGYDLPSKKYFFVHDLSVYPARHADDLLLLNGGKDNLVSCSMVCWQE